jgi:hypothetical protein
MAAWLFPNSAPIGVLDNEIYSIDRRLLHVGYQMNVFMDLATPARIGEERCTV